MSPFFGLQKGTFTGRPGQYETLVPEPAEQGHVVTVGVEIEFLTIVEGCDDGGHSPWQWSHEARIIGTRRPAVAGSPVSSCAERIGISRGYVGTTTVVGGNTGLGARLVTGYVQGT